ncbi:gamma-glutamyltransferase [Utexia brackfieldae]
MTPIYVQYRDYTAYNLPPNTQGMSSLAILNILNNIDVKSLGEGTPAYYHALIEATKVAFIDCDNYLTDPNFNYIPVDFLLSKSHGQAQAKSIDMTKAKHDLTLLNRMVWYGR